MVTPSEQIEGLVLNEDGAVEIPEMFAGYVEEENATIDAIMDHALKDCYLPGGFDGYLSGDEDYLLQQMCAIWYVLQQSKIRYSNATDVPGSAACVRVQNVRFFDQVLAASRKLRGGNVSVGLDLSTVQPLSVSYFASGPHVFGDR